MKFRLETFTRSASCNASHGLGGKKARPALLAGRAEGAGRQMPPKPLAQGAAVADQASCSRRRAARSLGAGWVDRKLLELSPDSAASFSSALTQAWGLYLRAFMNFRA